MEQKTKTETHSHPHMVNIWQTQEHRREKYWLLRSLGRNSYQAQRERDWRLSKIERRHNLNRNNITLLPDGRTILISQELGA